MEENRDTSVNSEHLLLVRPGRPSNPGEHNMTAVTREALGETSGRTTWEPNPNSDPQTCEPIVVFKKRKNVVVVCYAVTDK